MLLLGSPERVTEIVGHEPNGRALGVRNGRAADAENRVAEHADAASGHGANEYGRMAPESNGDYRVLVLVTGVVLAAGRSERMGRPKALLDFRGRSFLESVLETMQSAGIVARVVVAGPNAELVRALVPGDTRLVGAGTGPHPIGSVRAGVRAAGDAQAILVWPVDHPHVRVATVQALLGAFRGTTTPVVAPSFRRRRGHPVIWARATWRALLEDQAGESHGARGVARLFPVVHVTVTDSAVVEDIDTPQAYARLLLDDAAGDP